MTEYDFNMSMVAWYSSTGTKKQQLQVIKSDKYEVHVDLLDCLGTNIAVGQHQISRFIFYISSFISVLSVILS